MNTDPPQGRSEPRLPTCANSSENDSACGRMHRQHPEVRTRLTLSTTSDGPHTDESLTRDEGPYRPTVWCTPRLAFTPVQRRPARRSRPARHAHRQGRPPCRCRPADLHPHPIPRPGAFTMSKILESETVSDLVGISCIARGTDSVRLGHRRRIEFGDRADDDEKQSLTTRSESADPQEDSTPSSRRRIASRRTPTCGSGDRSRVAPRPVALLSVRNRQSVIAVRRIADSGSAYRALSEVTTAANSWTLPPNPLMRISVGGS